MSSLTPPATDMDTSDHNRYRPALRRLSIACLLALITLCVGWELAWAPIRPGGSWLVLKVLPLLAMLPGLLKSRLYSFQWASMAILLYLAEGSVRATSDPNPLSAQLAWLEVALSTVLFGSLLMYAKTFKRPKTHDKPTESASVADPRAGH